MKFKAVIALLVIALSAPGVCDWVAPSAVITATYSEPVQSHLGEMQPIMGFLEIPDEGMTFGFDMFPIDVGAPDLVVHPYLVSATGYLVLDEYGHAVLDLSKSKNYYVVWQGNIPTQLIYQFKIGNAGVKLAVDPASNQQTTENSQASKVEVALNISVPDVVEIVEKRVITVGLGE